MNAMRDTLALKQRIDQLEAQNDALLEELAIAGADLDLIAGTLATTEEFTHWLLIQDLSSSVTYCGKSLKNSTQKSVRIENADDRTLACAWARARYASDGTRRIG